MCIPSRYSKVPRYNTRPPVRQQSRCEAAGQLQVFNRTTESWGGRPFSLTMNYKYDGFGRMRRAVSYDDGMIPEFSEIADVDLDANVIGVSRKYNSKFVQDAVMTMEGGKVTGVNNIASPYYADFVGNFPDGEYTLDYDQNGRLIADGTRQVKKITYHSSVDRPKRITMENGDYTASDYLPDGTLLNRTFSSKRIETVTSVNASGDTVRREVTRTTTNTNTYLGSFWTLSGSQKARRVLTPAGYVDLTTGHRYWYITNRQGSTTAVVDEAGKVVQRNGYYPSGTPFVLPTEAMWTKPQAIDEVTDQLHIGNRWMGHSGLNIYDNTARMHDPILMRYPSPDPLFSKYPDTSPWSHCSANPLNAVDLYGDSVMVSNANDRQLVINSLNQFLPKDMQGSTFSFTDKGMLMVNYNESAIKNPEVKKFLEEMNKIINHKDVTEVLFQKSYSSNGTTFNTTPDNPGFSMLKSDGFAGKNNIIVIDKDFRESTISVYEMIDPKSLKAANYKTVNISTSISDILFHEFMEVQYRNISGHKVLEMNNIGRKLLNFSARKDDETHNGLKK